MYFSLSRVVWHTLADTSSLRNRTFAAILPSCSSSSSSHSSPSLDLRFSSAASLSPPSTSFQPSTFRNRILHKGHAANQKRQLHSSTTLNLVSQSTFPLSPDLDTTSFSSFVPSNSQLGRSARCFSTQPLRSRDGNTRESKDEKWLVYSPFRSCINSCIIYIIYIYIYI